MALFRRRSERHDALDSAIADWKSRKSGEGAGLSSSTRDAIRLSALGSGPVQSSALAELFTPARRLALAGVFPAIVLAAALGYAVTPRSSQSLGYDVPDQPIHASKMNGEVVFVIASGDRAHSVYKSSQPDRFSTAPAFQTLRGAFSDNLDSGPDLVFYRID